MMNITAPRSARGRARAASRGLTLIELMVGLALALVVIFALVALFESNSRIRRHVDQAAQQIENGRYALELLRDDLHLAGYYGNVVPWEGYGAARATVPDVCASTVANILFTSSPLQWPVPVFGIAAGDATPGCVKDRKDGTDILVVRRTKTVPTAIGSLTGNSIYVQASGCNTELQQHKDFTRGLGSPSSTFALQKKGCAAAGDVYEFQTRIYYVSNEAIPTLRLLTISGTTTTNEPLVEGIDDMRIEFGRDTSGDGSPDEFRKCRLTADPCSVDPADRSPAGNHTQWANMMAVKVNLLARNVDQLSDYTDTKTYVLGSDPAADPPVGPFGDHYKRHAYSAVIRLMNPAGRREL
jgi:type IV pilus assembly protein PilW